jgi:hypothetical protein
MRLRVSSFPTICILTTQRDFRPRSFAERGSTSDIMPRTGPSHGYQKSQCATLSHIKIDSTQSGYNARVFVTLPLWPASCHCHLPLPPPPPPPLPPHPLTTSCPSSLSAFAGASRPPSSVRPPSHIKCPPIHPSPTPTSPGSYDKSPRSSSLLSDSYEVRATLFRWC